MVQSFSMIEGGRGFFLQELGTNYQPKGIHQPNPRVFTTNLRVFTNYQPKKQLPQIFSVDFGNLQSQPTTAAAASITPMNQVI